MLDYSQGICSNLSLGPVLDTPGVPMDAPECSPSNITGCTIGDLSSKLGTISVSANPIGGVINAWTDGNLHNSTINNRSIVLRAANGSQELLACTNIVELTATNGIVDTDRTLFTITQRSPFDPTLISVGASIPTASYQINVDGNVRDSSTRNCYSDEVFEPFQATNTNVTVDSYPVGALSSKHAIMSGDVLSDTILPLSNRYSALGHNVMITPDDGSSATCATLSFPSGSNVRIVQATADFNGNQMTGVMRFVSYRDLVTIIFEMYSFLDTSFHHVKHWLSPRTNPHVLAVEIQR